MVQVNKTAGKVLGVALSTFTLAGCTGDFSYGCPNHSGRTASSSRDLIEVNIEFTKKADGMFSGEKTYEYSKDMFDPTAEKMKKRWVCDGELPDGAELKNSKSLWWGL